MKKFCDHNWAEQDTAIACDGLCPLCLQNENKRLKEELEFIADEWEWCPCGAAEHAKKALKNVD